MKMELLPVQTPLITGHDDLTEILLKSLKSMEVQLKSEDVVVVASKVVSLTEERVRKASDVEVSEEAERNAKCLGIAPALMQLILNESDSVFQGSPGFVLAERNGFPCVNACIDAANSPEGTFILPPANSDESAWRLRERIRKSTGKRVAVIIADSGLLPGRKGTIGVALGFAGLMPAKNYVGKRDLYGRLLRVTYQSVIDDIASAAKLLMGEADERVPFVVVRGAPVQFTEKKVGIESTLLPPSICVFMSNITEKRKV
jgi:coenzyme F420-0:L-glutamate ligase